MPRRTLPILVIALSLASSGLAAASVGAIDGREIPAPFAPLEYLVGSWKGQGVPLQDRAQRVRGWTETHSWAWSFVDGKPVGMSVDFEGSTSLKRGSLSYDVARKKYVLKVQPVSPTKDGETLVYEGGLDGSKKLLTLDRVDAPAGKPAERLTLRANSNFVRYTLGVERRSSKAGPYTRSVEVGLTKEGETFAAGASTTEKPKCVVTGGAATQTVSYQGKDFPICCSGCRDEFLETPDKYVKKASAPSTPTDVKAKAAPSRKPRGDDDAFSGDVEEPAERGKASP